MLQRIAAKGDAEAQYLLGVFYLNGVTGPRNPTLARGWFEKSATQGNPRAAFSLATLLASADPPDPQASAHCCSARTNSASAPVPGLPLPPEYPPTRRPEVCCRPRS